MNGYSPFENQQWSEFRNDAGTEIPAFGVIRITGAAVISTGRVVLTADQSNTYGAQYGHAINGPSPVRAGKYGGCARSQFMVAKYDGDDGTPAAGELWGPRDVSNWRLRKNTGGFRVIGVTNTTRELMLVTPAPFLFFRGTAAEDIAQNMRGDVNIWIRNNATSAPFYDIVTGQAMEDVLNDLDGDIDSGAALEVRFDPNADGTPNWRITQADCPA